MEKEEDGPSRLSGADLDVQDAAFFSSIAVDTLFRTPSAPHGKPTWLRER